jgi:hypothetical protein
MRHLGSAFFAAAGGANFIRSIRSNIRVDKRHEV